MQRGPIVVSAPPESNPEDIVLGIETDEAFQSLSLLDGTRTSRDVEHISDASAGTGEVTPAEEFEHTHKTRFGDEARIAGPALAGAQARRRAACWRGRWAAAAAGVAGPEPERRISLSRWAGRGSRRRRRTTLPPPWYFPMRPRSTRKPPRYGRISRMMPCSGYP